MTTQTIAGITLPDTPLVKDVTEYIRDVEDDLLFDHSRRVFLFGALQGQRRGLEPDLELLYVGAMFHDIGLTAGCRTSMLRFEVDGANAARDFLLERGFDEPAEAALDAVTAAHPRPDFKRRILEAFTIGNVHRPRSTFGNVNADVLAHYDPTFVRDDFVETILANSWPE
jgi:hypothetical protein